MLKIRTEVKIGFIVLVTIALVLWGINFLKGRNILNSSDVYYAVYENTLGIDVSAPVLINGYKVGIVNKVQFADENLDKLIISFRVDDKYRIPLNSIVELHSADLLGTKALRIIPGNTEAYHQFGDTLISGTEKDMLSSLSEQILPLKTRAESAVEEIDSLLSSINYILDTGASEELKNSISQLNSFSASLAQQLGPGGDLQQTLQSVNELSQKLNENRDKVDTIFTNIQSLSDSLANAHITEMLNSINRTFIESSIILEKINQGEGTLGQLSSNDSLYYNLNSAVESLDILLKDLNENPKRYIHFSLFGRKDKPE